jgi:thiamine-phosphate pyrophosphorylase
VSPEPIPIIYPVLDTAVCAAHGIDLLAMATACFRGGARLLQLRAKADSSAHIAALADVLVAAARPFGARVIINDRADIALMSGAAGVHVGQTDLPVDAVRDVLGPAPIVGVSTHDREQIDRALATSASYVAVGPLFLTATKDTGYDPRGLDLVAYAAGRGKPIVGIGGITLERASSVVAAGASAVAVITDLLTGDQVEARVRAYCQTRPRESFRV